MQEYPLLDVVAHNVADEGKSDKLVIARLWWSSLLAQHIEKKRKGKNDAKEPIQKWVIKKEYNLLLRNAEQLLTFFVMVSHNYRNFLY